MENQELEPWLQQFIQRHGAVAGTVHRRVAEDELELAAAVNIPPPVLEKTRRIPRGKGMAGLALEREQPVSTCNLKTDTTGDVRPGAKAVNAQAAVALPVTDANGRVHAVVGLAFMDERELGEPELEQLGADAATVPID